MSKLACVALLIAISLQAQNAPSPREKAPERESAPQPEAQPSEVRIVERELPAEESRKLLLDLGYDFSQVKIRVLPSTQCAIPLIPLPIPDKNFAMRNNPASPSIDPKIALTPSVPACSQTVAPLIVKPVELAAEKK
jgi:hypothetical protein